MSVKDLNKCIIVSSALTGEIIHTMPYEDFLMESGQYYLDYKINDLIAKEQGALIKIGYKN